MTAPLEFLCRCEVCGHEWVQSRPPTDARTVCVNCRGPVARWWFRSRATRPRPRWSSSARYREHV